MSTTLMERRMRRGKLARERRLARARGEEVLMEYGPLEEGRGPRIRVVHQYEIPKTMLGPRLQRAPTVVKEAIKEAYKEPITYVAPPEEAPKGIGEFLAEISIQKPLAQLTSAITGTPVEGIMQIQEMQKKVMPYALRPVEPVKLVGGLVASVEAPVYTVARLVGVDETPRPPPTVSGGLLAAVLFGDPSELEKLKEYGPEYARGTILGDIALSLALGWAGEKAWAGLKKIPVVKKAPLAVEKVKHVTMEAILKKAPVRLQKWYFGPSYKEWKMSQQLLWEKPPFAGYKEFYLTTETMLPTKIPGEQWLLVTKGARLTPMATTLAKVGVYPTLGGLISPQQIIATEYAKRAPLLSVHYPITDVPTRLATRGLARALLGFGVMTGLKAAPRLKAAPKLKLRLKPFPIVKPFIKTVSITKAMSLTEVVQRQESVVKQIQKQVPTTVQVQKQLLRTQQIQVRQQLQRQVSAFRWPRFRLPTAEKRKKKKPLLGAWFFKKHPVPTPEELIRRLRGGQKRKSRRKKKRTRRKKK